MNLYNIVLLKYTKPILCVVNVSVVSIVFRYVPPKASADVESWLCEDKPMIEAELNKQNNLLALLHRKVRLFLLGLAKPRETLSRSCSKLSERMYSKSYEWYRSR